MPLVALRVRAKHLQGVMRSRTLALRMSALQMNALTLQVPGANENGYVTGTGDNNSQSD
jgi:hypothetical protein